MSRLWAPDDLASPPFGWFDAASPATITLAGPSVASWASRSGPLTLENATDQRPTLVADALNGLAAIDFSVGRLFNRQLAIPAGTPISVFTVGNILTSKAADYFRGVCFVTGTDNDVFSGKTPITTLPNGSGQSPTVRRFGYSIFNPSSAEATLDAFHLLEGYSTDGTSCIAAVDAAPGITGSSAPTYGATLTSIVVSGSGNGDANFWPGSFAEIIVILGGLSADDVARIEGYLAWRWGLQANLPASHACYAAPPTVSSGGPTLNAAGVPVSLSGRAAQLLHGHTLPAAPGVVGISGQPLRAVAGRRITGGPGAITLITHDVALRQGRMLSAAGGSLRRDGQAAQLLHGYTLPAGVGSLAIVGRLAQLRRSPQLTAAGGSIELTGRAASLDRVGRHSLGAAGDTFSVTAGSAGLQLQRRMIAGPGLLLLTGGAIMLVKPGRYTITGATGAFAAGGSAVSSRSARRMVAEARQLAWAGAPAVLRVARRIAPATGVFTLSPRSATLTIGRGLPPITIPLSNRFIVPARQRRFTMRARQRVFFVRKGTSMSINKYPGEERQYLADWSADLDGQALTGEIAATSSDPALIVDRVTHQGAAMTFWLRGGTPRAISQLTFIAPTTGGERIAWQQLVRVF